MPRCCRLLPRSLRYAYGLPTSISVCEAMPCEDPKGVVLIKMRFPASRRLTARKAARPTLRLLLKLFVTTIASVVFPKVSGVSQVNDQLLAVPFVRSEISGASHANLPADGVSEYMLYQTRGFVSRNH